MLGNLILETTNAPGTNANCNLAGPVAGRLGFGFWFTSGAACFYVLNDGTQQEWGIGTYTSGSPNVLARTTVLKNSAGTTARLNFLGSTRVYNEVPAERSLWVDNSNNVTFPAGIAVNAITIANTAGAQILLRDNDAGTNQQYYGFISNSGSLSGQAWTDALTSPVNWLNVTRTGTTINSITLAGTAINLTGNAAVSGTLSVTGAANTGNLTSSGFVNATTYSNFAAGLSSTAIDIIAAATPVLSLRQTGAGTDLKIWDFTVNATTLGGRAVNDAYNSSNQWLTVTRSGTTITGITLAGTAINLTGATNVTGNEQVNGSIVATGTMQANGGRIISQGAANATVSVWSTTASFASGIYCDGANLNFAQMDGSGNAISYWGQMTSGGNLSMQGNIIAVGALQGTGVTLTNGLIQIAAGYYLARGGSDGYWRFVENNVENFRVETGGHGIARDGLYAGNVSGTTGKITPSQFACGSTFYLYGDSGGRTINYTGDGWHHAFLTGDGSHVYYNNLGQALSWTDGSGNLHCRGTLSQNDTSDERTKQDIEPYTRGLADLIKLKPISFNYNGLGGTRRGEKRIGLSAQQARPFIPECVIPTRAAPVDPNPDYPAPPDERLPDQLSFDDRPLWFAMLNAIRELSDQNTALAARLVHLEGARP